MRFGLLTAASLVADCLEIDQHIGRGARFDDQLRTDGPSPDHVIAKALSTRPFYFKPLGYPLNFTAISYDDAGEEVPYEYNLLASFRDWFGVGPAAEKAISEVAAESAVLGFLRNDARRLRARLAIAERLKVDAHLDALHVLEQRLRQPPRTDCPAPAVPGLSLGNEGYLRTVMDFAFELFSCGLTQSLTLVLDVGQDMPWLGLGNLQMHDDVAHLYRPDDPTRVRQLSILQRWYATQVAYLIQIW